MRTARQRDMQRASRIRRPHIVSETPPPPEMTIVFSPSEGLAEKPVGLARAGLQNFSDGRAGRHLSPRPVPGRGRLARGSDGVHDVLIASAPAEITLEPGADVLLG